MMVSLRGLGAGRGGGLEFDGGSVAADAADRLSGYVVDRNFMCAVVLCGYPSRVKSAIAARLAALTDAVVLDTDSYAAPGGAEPRCWPVRSDGEGCVSDAGVRRLTFPSQAFSVLLKVGLGMARHRPVVIDAPCFGHARVAAARRIRLADYLCRCAGEDVAVVAAWIDAEGLRSCRWPGPGALVSAGRVQQRGWCPVVDVVIGC